MKADIIDGANQQLKLTLDDGELAYVQKGFILQQSANIAPLKGPTGIDLLSKIRLKMWADIGGGLSEMQSQGTGAYVVLGRKLPGKVLTLNLSGGEKLLVHPMFLLAAESGVSIEVVSVYTQQGGTGQFLGLGKPASPFAGMQHEGAATMLMGSRRGEENLILSVTGPGNIFLYGSITEHDVNGQEFDVKNKMLVAAFDPLLDYKWGTGLIGIGATFNGKGKVYVST